MAQSSTSSKILVADGLFTDTHERPSSAEEKRRNNQDSKTSCVQICPHDNLSFERMKRIVRLPNFKFNKTIISAFTKNPSHHASSVAGIILCKPYPEGFSSLQAKSFYKYHSTLAGTGYHDTLILCVHWTMEIDKHNSNTNSVSDFQKFLDKYDVHLCPHMKMSHLSAKLHRLCNPSSPAEDPVVAYEEEYRSGRIKGCEGCDTAFQAYNRGSTCHILAKRYLGKGGSAYEKRWLAQCGGQKHRLRSLGVAALERLRI